MEEHDDFESLYRRAWDLQLSLRVRSAFTLAGEARARAREQRNFAAYVRATFQVFNSASGLYENEMRKSAAIETIALLESWDAARTFQSGVDEGTYRRLVHQYAPCAYDHLASSIGAMRGMNSPELDHALEEGISVCRRTGNLSCIGCFRAYGRDQALAADDVDMALHYCRTARAPGSQADGVKRFAAAAEEVDISIDLGDLDRAARVLTEARGMVDDSFFVADSDLRCQHLAAVIDLLQGREPSAIVVPERARPFDPAELPDQDVSDKVLAALVAGHRRDHDTANTLLEECDRRLLRLSALDRWFDVRLRLIANDLVAGRTDRVDKLAKQLEAKAGTARDHYTLRRLRALQGAGANCQLHAPLAAKRIEVRGDVVAVADDGANGASAAPSVAAPPDPLQLALDDLAQRIGEARGDDAATAALEAELLAYELTDAAARVRRTALFALYRLVPFATDPAASFAFARSAAAGLEEDGIALSYLASIGHLLVSKEGSDLADVLPVEMLTHWTERSVELLPDNVAVRARAAMFFQDRGDDSRAERLLARAARLDRTDAWVARRLAALYAKSDRRSDALAVLDLCLRGGSEDIDVLWDAIGYAAAAREYRSLATYAESYVERSPDDPWGAYYRQLAYGGLGDHERVLAELRGAREQFASFEFAWASFEASATAISGADPRAAVAAFLELPTSAVEQFTSNGIYAALLRVHDGLMRCGSAPDALELVRTRLARLGLFTTYVAERAVEGGEQVQGTRYFDVVLEQQLDAGWDDEPQRLPDTAGWRALRATYGVLCSDRDEAVAKALAAHPKLASTEPVVVDVREDDRTYTDRPRLYGQFTFDRVDEPEA